MLTTHKSEIHLEIHIPANWSNKSVEAVLQNEFSISKKILHQWRMEKSVLLNHDTASLGSTLKQNDILSLPIYQAEKNDILPYNLPIKVTYEDDDLLIVDKPYMMNTHPVSENDSQTLINAVAHYFQIKKISTKPRHIHRLDKETSGLILFSKNAFTSTLLDHMLSKRMIERSYQSLVSGLLRTDKGTICIGISRDRHANKMRATENGQSAITHFKVLKRFSQKKQTFIQCKLETGRTHQIRVHLAHLGHPLVGDHLYGDNSESRLALHASQLQFKHPISGKQIDCISSFPCSEFL